MSIPQRIFRGFHALREVTGLSRSQIQREMAAGRFPKPIPLTPTGRGKGWLGEEVAIWQQDRKQARELDKKIRAEIPSGSLGDRPSGNTE
jgi:prophage regulatory protein